VLRVRPALPRGICLCHATKRIGSILWLKAASHQLVDLNRIVVPISQRTAENEVSTMKNGRTTTLIVCVVVLGAALGCTSQPTAPSNVASAPTAGSSASSAPIASTSQNAASPARFGDRTPGVVYVTSQGLYYDTFVVKDPLPMQGRFQLLVNGQTEFGPGQAGYLGGRWWEDTNGNGAQDSGDHFFLCPLLPPGRSTP
jgi:hypothetical protein